MKKNNETKVICANCGAEIVIPNNEIQGVLGTVVGKDSGLGVVVLPTTDCCGEHSNAEITPIQAIDRLEELARLSPEMREMVASLKDKIEGGGYLEVKGIVRRWIPSQCLRMVYSQLGFHCSLVNKGYCYSWEVLINDLKVQEKLFRNNDMKEYEQRNSWYNKKIAEDMALHFIESLNQAIPKMSVRRHDGREYIRLRCSLNNGLGVHLDELWKLKNPLYAALKMIRTAATPDSLLHAVEIFNKRRKAIRNWEPCRACPSFMNAYKAAGAYYTIKDLIMFEGCVMRATDSGDTDRSNSYDWRLRRDTTHFVNTKLSLEYLDKTAKDVVKCVEIDGYKMLGLLKDFLEYNNFNYKETTERWLKASEERSELRKSVRGSRRSRR